jgi:imidazolonepropionase-like amidohydrolase
MMDASATQSLLICCMFHADLGTLDQLKQVLPRNLTKKIVAAGAMSGQDPNTTDTIMQLRPKFAKDLSVTSQPMRCDVCHRSAEEAMKVKMAKCGKCQNVRYCSVACQRRDWPEHKIVCK